MWLLELSAPLMLYLFLRPGIFLWNLTESSPVLSVSTFYDTVSWIDSVFKYYVDGHFQFQRFYFQYWNILLSCFFNDRGEGCCIVVLE